MASITEEALKILRERLELLAERGIMGAEYQAALRQYEETRQRRARESDGTRAPAMEEFEERVTARRIAEEQAKMDAYANAMRDVYGSQMSSPNTEAFQTSGGNTSLAPVKPRAPAEPPTTGINVLGKRQIEID